MSETVSEMSHRLLLIIKPLTSFQLRVVAESQKVLLTPCNL